MIRGAGRITCLKMFGRLSTRMQLQSGQNKVSWIIGAIGTSTHNEITLHPRINCLNATARFDLWFRRALRLAGNALDAWQLTDEKLKASAAHTLNADRATRVKSSLSVSERLPPRDSKSTTELCACVLYLHFVVFLTSLNRICCHPQANSIVVYLSRCSFFISSFFLPSFLRLFKLVPKHRGQSSPSFIQLGSIFS